MEREIFETYAEKAFREGTVAKIVFDKPTRVLAYGKLLNERKEITIRFFVAEKSTDTKMRYGYKLRKADKSGYPIDLFPVEYVASVEIDAASESDKHAIAKETFLHYWNTKVDTDVWKTVYQSIDSILDKRTATDINKRLCIPSRAGEVIADEIKRAFNERRDANIMISDTMFFKSRNGQDGYRAWLVTNKATWIVLNPKVAVLPKKIA